MYNRLSFQKFMILTLLVTLGTSTISAASITNAAIFNPIGALIGVVIILFLILVSIGDNMIQYEAKKAGVDTSKENMSIFPRIADLVSGNSKKSTADGRQVNALKRGYDIKLEGIAQPIVDKQHVTRYAVKPQNFRGITPIPRVYVEVGEEVKAGQPIFADKKDERVKHVAPVSGEVVEIRRGAKRSISHIVILADKEMQYIQYDVPNLSDRDAVVQFLLNTGGWGLLNKRPFDVVPDPDTVPRDIFISGFDTAPLAPDASILVEGKEAQLQKGIEVLNALTDGDVFLGLEVNSPEALTNLNHAEKHYFSGPHPVGNVGIQMHHTKPVGSNDHVWTVTLQDLMTIGELFISGRFDASRRIAITGAQVEFPKYIDTYLGANVGDLVSGNTLEGRNRIIAGDVLSGKQTEADDFLNVHDDQITVIKEGNYFEPFGWLIPGEARPSISKTYLTSFFKDITYAGDTNTHGERRAFVVTGQYESVLPMSIYPQMLFKSILTNNFERMEGLGISELSEEDVALCEFVCTSKMPLQSILRQGLDIIREQS